MFFIKLYQKIFRIVGYIVAGLFFFTTIFLLILSFKFNNDKTESNIFGYNIFIVKTSGVGNISKDNAVLSKKIPPENLSEGDYVIYNADIEKSAVLLGIIKNISSAEDVFSFEILSESGEDITISQGQIIAKSEYTSRFLGAVIGFASSDAGVFCLAILPCAAIILLEIIKIVIAKRPPPRIAPIKKVDDKPVSVPVQKIHVDEKGIGVLEREKKPLPKGSAAGILVSMKGKSLLDDDDDDDTPPPSRYSLDDILADIETDPKKGNRFDREI